MIDFSSEAIQARRERNTIQFKKTVNLELRT